MSHHFDAIAGLAISFACRNYLNDLLYPTIDKSALPFLLSIGHWIFSSSPSSRRH